MPLQPPSFLLIRTPLQAFSEAYKVQIDEPTAIFREGLYLSSPAYWQEYQKRSQLTVKEKEKIERSFNKYWIRSCMRSTPYGTFAGSMVANISEEDTNVILTENSRHRRSMRVDMNYITGLITAITLLPHVRHQLKLYPNNSIYELPNGFRYAEYTINNNTRNYQLTSIGKTSYIKAILQTAVKGASIRELSDLLVSKENVTAVEAASFVDEMWQSQLLVSELEPCVTGKEPLDELIERLDSFNEVEELVTSLKIIQQLVRNPQEGVAHYERIEEELRKIAIKIEIPKNTLQTDLFLSAHENHINKELITAVLTQAEDLLSLAVEHRNGELEDFKNKFYARYEEAEVPLTIVLDADLGIGYAGVRDESTGGGDWIDDLAIVGRGGQTSKSDFTYTEQFALSKYNDYLKENKPAIEITEEELNGFKKRVENFRFPNSLYLMGSLLQQDGKLSPEHFLFDVSGLGGPSAANLLGRFTHGDQQLCSFTKEILKLEEAEHPDAIYAEIAHLPQARIGNILLRPALRNYEIPYVGKSGAPAENQILVEDILVSVRNSEVILRSKSRNKRIIPRLTTAHNFSYKSLPVYKFLCDLQSQGLAYPNAWDWGNLATLKHLPRVTYKNLILKKARWKIHENDIKDLPKIASEYSVYFKTFCKKNSIPSRVVYAESDNELLIDFEEEKGIDLFLHYLKKYKKIQLEEFLFTEDNCFAKDVNGNPFTNEVIIPLYKATPQVRQPSIEPPGTSNSIQRRFAPNSEWQYFKVYCGSKTAEKILSETVLPFIETGIEQKLFERFFFIRYRDESGHFRIRFYNTDKTKQQALQHTFMLLLQPLLEEGAISKIMLDTYNREIERYSAEIMEETESIFYNDSLAVLRFINMLDGTDSERYRLLFALRGIDMLLNDFNFNLFEKHTLLKIMQNNFFKEFGASPILQKQLNEKYRKHQQDIFSHLNPSNDITNEIDEAAAVFEIRSEMNGTIISIIKNKLQQRNELLRLNDLLPSYVHMFMNRLFIAQQRKYELVVYHFLEKFYASQLAISKVKTPLLVTENQPL